jgi:hypothetical protein
LIPVNYSKCQKFFPNHPENPLFEKSRFSGPFRQKLSSYSETTLMLFRTLPGAPAATKHQEMKKLLAIAITKFNTVHVSLRRSEAAPQAEQRDCFASL